MKYMTFIRHSESYRESGPPQALMEAMDVFVQRLIREGAFVDGGGLKASREGVRMRLAKGKLTVLDGPFTETKEIVGGYAILEAATRTEAPRDRHGVHGAAPPALARVRGRVRGAADVRRRGAPLRRPRAALHSAA